MYGFSQKTLECIGIFVIIEIGIRLTEQSNSMYVPIRNRLGKQLNSKSFPHYCEKKLKNVFFLYNHISFIYRILKLTRFAIVWVFLYVISYDVNIYFVQNVKLT